MKRPARPDARARLRIRVRGAVQGVGFRPFVHRLATDLALTGWVNNSPQGVLVEAESPRPVLEQFLQRLAAEKPPRSFIQSLEATWLDAAGFTGFEIRASDTGGDKTALVLPDSATCPDCLREIFDPKNRRFRHPFTNCTNCGPRFSLIEALPYDRANTSMKAFALCPECAAEYRNPGDRRFHAQPNACPACGPRLELWDADGAAIFGGDEALLAAARAIRRGKIVAVKGVGGFHLLADARRPEAIQRLRERKHREEKPFALMFPTVASIRANCEVSPLEERLLLSPEAPIVLLRRRAPAGKSDGKFSVAAEVAPRNPQLGVMLPANPLHHLLMAELGFPVVATSGNLSEEPVCIDEQEALVRLRGLADFFLVHDRPIVRQVDDSIVRVILDREMILRRARGYAPLPLPLPKPEAAARTQTVLAVGAQLKNAVALAVGDNVFISQHIGDLETESADQAFRRVITDFQKLYGTEAEIVAGDLHPDYGSTRYARACGKPFVGVQHHVAHVLSCIAENEVALPALGVAWDGTGYGPDGTIWGGEFFVVSPAGVERRARLRLFPLPGGEAAIKEPRRAALGLLYEMFGAAIFERNGWAPVAAFSASELTLLRTMLERGLNSPRTSSIGRLFDAAASVTGLRQRMRFEGQAAMDLEFALGAIKTDAAYELRIVECSGAPPASVAETESARRKSEPEIMLDWFPLVAGMLADGERGIGIDVVAAKFHNALAEAVVGVARRLGQARVALSGGCFQNRYLTERVVRRLREEQFLPYWHQRVPANDGGIAFGQIVAARNHLQLK